MTTQEAAGLSAAMVDGIRVLLGHGYVLYRLGDSEAFLRQPTNAVASALLDLPYVASHALRRDRYVRLSLDGDSTRVEFARTPIWPGSKHP